MSDRRGIGGDAVALLLTLMETAEAELSGEALQDFYPAAGAALIAAGALQPSGYEPVVTCLDNPRRRAGQRHLARRSRRVRLLQCVGRLGEGRP